MTSVDDLFRKSNLPIGSLKRKLEVPDADAAYKSTKVASRSSPNGRPSVEDAADEDDIEAGPKLPPDDDETNDDDEGRFFGGGVSRDQAEALDYIEEQDGEEDFREEKIDSAWLKRLSTSFEKKVAKNSKLRARYEGEPAKFMQSEADLDTEIKSWSLLSEHPELYSEFAASGSVEHVVNLLAHENPDIAIGAIEIVSELLDEDVEAEQDQWDALVAALLQVDFLELLMSNLARLNEEEESDRSGVYHSLSVLESFGSQEVVAEKVGSVNVLNWLCDRIRQPEKITSQNKQYAAEVLQVLLQSSSVIRKRIATEVDAVDLFLQLLAAYRKRDPSKDGYEQEYAENLFDALTCVLDEAEGKAKFVEAEGVELCLIMLKEGSMSKARALRMLDHAAAGATGAAEVCAKIVDAAGLKAIFHLFMKSKDNQTLEHLLGIFASMLRRLPGESAERIRMLAKFTEKQHEKVSKLLHLHAEYAGRLEKADEAIEAEQSQLEAEEIEARADEWLSRRLDGGLFCFRTLVVIIAWLAAEGPEVKSLVADAIDLVALKSSLHEQLVELGDDQEDEETGDMLETLIEFL